MRIFNALVMNCNMRSVVCRSGRFTTSTTVEIDFFCLEAIRNLLR